MPSDAQERRNDRKRWMAEGWLSEGLSIVVTFDPLHDGVVLPSRVKHEVWPARLTVWRFHEVDSDSFTCVIRFDKEVGNENVVIPWSAVYALTAEGWEEVHMWMQDKEIADAHYALLQSPLAAMRN